MRRVHGEHRPSSHLQNTENAWLACLQSDRPSSTRRTPSLRSSVSSVESSRTRKSRKMRRIGKFVVRAESYITEGACRPFAVVPKADGRPAVEVEIESKKQQFVSVMTNL